MTSTQNPLSSFILTPQQQNLLLAALNSNRQQGNAASHSALTQSPMSLGGSPGQGLGATSSFQNSPELDYDYDFGADSSFDFSMNDGTQPKMIGDLPRAPAAPRSDSADTESPDKRSHPDDDDDEDNVGANKRRESEDKVAKKPGRKPLTTEPSNKRKAQNRAAQRAFRERKEKHLKDLEDKVEELEKASQSANHENEKLRAKVDKMTVELNEYKKRVSLMGNNSRSALGGTAPGVFGSSVINNINDVNFQFEFPKFGTRPPANLNSPKPQSAPPVTKRNSNDQLSPMSKSDANSPAGADSYTQKSQSNNELSSFSTGLFSPPLTLTNVGIANASRGSMDMQYNATGAASISSPSASSNSNLGASSSCGTSPEPITQSPMGFKPLDTMTPIGEEQPGMGPEFDGFANMDMNDFNWLPQNFQFDPQLFGDYREPQESILTTGLDDTFFNDAFDMDFTTPYNLPLTSPPGPKKDILTQIDEAKNKDEVNSDGQLLTCNKIWEQLQNCPKVQSGDFDLDGLCSDLQKKAKCSGSGAVVDEGDFKAVMKKYLGKEGDAEDCQRAMGLSA